MTSGNPILDKNLECIEKYNPKLKEKLLSIKELTADIKLVETELKEPNLSYNGLFLHSQKGAENEAKEIFAKSQNTKYCINFIFGMGLGYLFKEFCEQAKGFSIIYEPNLEILRVTLEIVDFSKELSQKKVMLVSDIQEIKYALGCFYQYQCEIDFIVLDSYKQFYEKQIQDLVKQLEILKSACTLDFNLYSKKGFQFMAAALNNLTYSLESTPLGEIKGLYEGKTALIVSAGPTLDENLETIKKNRDKVIVFCVGPALKSLLSAGIKPDFMNVAEIADVSGQFNGLDLSGINLIVAPYTNTSTQKLEVKQRFLFPSSATKGAQYWSYVTGMDISEYISKGTVSSAALASAKMLGCKKLILVGQDLAFLNNSCYSKSSAYSDVIFETNPETGEYEYKIKDYKNFAKHLFPEGTENSEDKCKKLAENKIRALNERKCFVKGITGEMLFTTIDYASFIDIFREFAFYNTSLELINTSMKGAQIDGFKNIPLNKALKNEKSFEKTEISAQFKFNKDIILENLIKEQKYFKEILNEIEKTKEYSHKFDREIKRRRVVTEESFKYYTDMTKTYDEITNKYYKTNQFYQIFIFEEHAKIQHYISTTKDLEQEKIKNTYELLKLYFNNLNEKLLKILEIVDKQITYIRENKIN